MSEDNAFIYSVTSCVILGEKGSSDLGPGNLRFILSAMGEPRLCRHTASGGGNVVFPFKRLVSAKSI